MAILTGENLTYTYGLAATGVNREDLMGLITNVDPTEHIFLATCPKVPCTGPYHQFLTDTLATTSISTRLEGDQFTPSAYSFTQPSRQVNWTSILGKDI